MADQKKSNVVLEREYIVPLRKGWLKVQEYKRANKAVKTLKEFIAQHMKLYDNDLRKVKIDPILNNELRFRGMKKPPAKIRVKALKLDSGVIEVLLVEVPAHIEFAQKRAARKAAESASKKAPPKKETEKKDEGEEEKKEDIETKEKEAAAKEETQQIAKQHAKSQKHLTKDKNVRVHRKALSR